MLDRFWSYDLVFLPGTAGEIASFEDNVKLIESYAVSHKNLCHNTQYQEGAADAFGNVSVS